MARKKVKRDLFTELMEGLREIKAHRQGEIKLQAHRSSTSRFPDAKKKVDRPSSK